MADYSVFIGAWKSVKDLAMAAVAAGIAIVFTNLTGLANQCPDATVTVVGVTISLKALMNFINNYRKNKDGTPGAMP